MARIRLGDFGNAVAPLAPPSRVPVQAFVRGDGGFFETGQRIAARGVAEERAARDQQIERERKSRRAASLQDALGRATADLAELELNFDRDQDFKTAPVRFLAEAKKLRDKYASGFDDEVVTQAFGGEFQKLSLAKYVNIRKDSAKKERDYNVASLDTNLDVFAQGAATARSPEERILMQREAQIAIAAAVTSGYVDPVDAGKRQRTFLSRTDDHLVRRDIAQAPGATADRLALDAEYAPNLDPSTRQRWIDTAYRRDETERVRVERDEERERRKRGDDLLKEAFARHEAGKLTREYIEQVRAFVEPAEYRSLLKGLREGAGGKNDETALADLHRILYVENNPTEAERKAFQYQKAGLLKSTTLGQFLGTSRTHARQEGPRSPYERERAYIVNVIRPSEMVQDPAASARFAMAIREYDDYALQAGVERQPKELREKADDILKRLSIVNMVDIARKTGIEGRNDPQQVLDAITGKALRLRQDFEQKRISKVDFDKKMQALNDARKAAEKNLGR
jgi:hypothetical protein